jgi:hypothetical protein
MITICDKEIQKLPAPNQIYGEWKSYLKTLQCFFEARNILNPVIVEIGTQTGRQKEHYEKFFDATHIGIDKSEKYAKPDILGDSHDPETLATLKERLGTQDVNVVFIDADHEYEDVKKDYEMYGPLAQDIIAFHDISGVKTVKRLWAEICEQEKGNSELEFLAIGDLHKGWCELGIGLIIKKQNRWRS